MEHYPILIHPGHDGLSRRPNEEMSATVDPKEPRKYGACISSARFRTHTTELPLRKPDWSRLKRGHNLMCCCASPVAYFRWLGSPTARVAATGSDTSQEEHQSIVAEPMKA